MSLFGDVVRGASDIMTFGSNEVLGNPVGKAADQIVNPTDPNAAANANAASFNQQQVALAQKNIDLQKEFAQNGISWRIADAAKNGISPLAALGASEPGFSPVTQAFAPMAPSQPSLGHDLLSAGASEFGQGLSRALLTTQDPVVKASALADLAWKTKQNDLLDVQLASSKLALAKMAHSSGTTPMDPAYSYVLNADGSPSRVPTYNTHGAPFGNWAWFWDNQMVPAGQAVKGFVNELVHYRR